MAGKKGTKMGKGASSALPREYAQGLVRVRRAAQKHAAAREYLDDAIREARADGASLRAVAEEAGLSHEWVRRIADG
jgi:hypothetical protein